MFRVSTLVSSFKFQISSHTESTDNTEKVAALKILFNVYLRAVGKELIGDVRGQVSDIT